MDVEHTMLDRFSSAIRFDGWKEASSWAITEDYGPLKDSGMQPELALARRWKMYGPISVHERPGKLAAKQAK